MAITMDNGRNPTTKPTCLTAKILHWLVDDQFPSLRPDILVLDEMSLQGFGVDGKVLFTPGHTAGSIVSFLQACMNIFWGAGIVGCRGGSLRRTADLEYQTQESWSRTRRVVAKVEHLPGKGSETVSPQEAVRVAGETEALERRAAELEQPAATAAGQAASAAGSAQKQEQIAATAKASVGHGRLQLRFLHHRWHQHHQNDPPMTGKKPWRPRG